MLKIISMFIGILILGIGEVIFGKIVLDEDIKVSKLKLVLIVLFVTGLCTLTNYYLDGITKTIVGLIIYVFKFKFIFDIEYSKSILLTIIYVILLMIPEMLVLFCVNKLPFINTNYFYTDVAGKLIGNIIIMILQLLLTLLTKKKTNRIVNIKLESNTKLIIFSILTVMCTIIIFYNTFTKFKFDASMIINIFIMLAFVIVLLNLIKQTVYNNNLVRKYEQILEFMTTYEDEVEKQRILRHETKNAFLSIKAQLTDKAETKDIINYIDSILEDDVKIKNEEYAKFKYLPANGIKGLCYYKIQEAENRNIKVSINISSRIKKSSLSKLSVKEIKELGKILGVYLDNAIEASVKSDDKKLGFEAYLIDDKVKIIISNTYKGELAKEKIGNVTYSTKGKNRGHGLLLVKEIVSNNKMFDIDTEITDSLYIQSLTIEK